MPGVSRAIGIRYHWAILTSLLLVFSLASSFSYWYRSRTESRLDSSIQQDLFFHDNLPQIRNEIRQVHLLTESYLLSRNQNILSDRRRLIAEIRGHTQDMGRLSSAQRVRRLIPEFDRQLDGFLSAEEKILSSGVRPGYSAEIREQMDNLMEAIAALSDAAISGIQSRNRLAESASFSTFIVRLIIEFIATALIGLYLFGFIIRPIEVFEHHASHWTLGASWPAQPAIAVPEIHSLYERFADLTRRLNEEYGREKSLNQFKTKLVSLVSHEFGNSLTVIRNAASLLDEDAAILRVKNLQPLTRMILSHAQMLDEAVNNLLSMSRLEAGKLAMDFSDVNLGELIKAAVSRLDGVASEKNIRVTLQMPHALRPVRADAATLSLALNNLFGNAIKYTPHGGRVTIGVMPAQDAQRCLVYVEDTGIGISKEDREKILSGYYRTESGQRMTSKGFGIGLSLTRQIVEAHGSALELESRPGKGSKFSFLLAFYGG